MGLGNDGVPLFETNSFPIWGSRNGYAQVNAVSFNYIRRTGNIDVLTGDQLPFENQKIIFEEPGEETTVFAEKYNELENRVLSALRRNPKITALLRKSSWTKSDRQRWEKILAEETSRIVDKVPGFDEYRVSTQEGNEHLKRASVFNEISVDIETYSDGVHEYETECELFTALEGSIIQAVENELLKNYEDSPQNVWKRPLTYFRVDGVKSYARGAEFKGHAWIITPTGNVIESTTDPSKTSESPYKKVDASLELWASGEVMLVDGTDEVYAPYWVRFDGENGRNDTVRDQISASLEAKKLHIIGPEKSALFSKDGNYALEERLTEKGYTVVAYRKVDIGSADERFIPIDVQTSQKLDNSYVFSYTDKLKDQVFRFSVFEENPVIECCKRNAYEADQNHNQWEKISQSSTSGQPSPLQENTELFRDNTEICGHIPTDPKSDISKPFEPKSLG